MYRCSLVAVGHELLDGRVADTNSDFITGKLASLGVEVSLRVIVGDSMEDIRVTLSWVMGVSDIIIITGGLGPTDDDLTREAVAETLGLPLKRNPQIEEHVRAIFERMGREMAPTNLKQAELIAGATPLPARLGTAPGQWIEHQGKIMALIPGVPREMRNMMENDVLPRLSARLPLKRTKRAVSLHAAAMPESEVAELVHGVLYGCEDITISYRALPGQIEVRLSAWDDGGEAFDQAKARVREALGPWLVAEDEETLEGNLGRELRSRGLSLAVAESITGGMVGERITRVPGSSDYFKGGMVTYSYQAKEKLLGVEKNLLLEKGAVCEEVAEAMARGVKERFSSDIGVSVTGVAGPGSGGEKEPVGTVAFGLAAKDGVYSLKYRLPGDRDMVRQVATTIILTVAYFYVRGEGIVSVR